jgi:hypothetical protein
LIRNLIFNSFFYEQDKVYLAAIDETVEGKSGKSTHGKGYFYSL